MAGSPDRFVQDQGGGAGGNTTIVAPIPLPVTDEALERSFVFNIQDATSVTGSGDHVIATPNVGSRFRLVWVGLFTSENNTAEVVTEVRLGTSRAFLLPMGNPYIFAHRTSKLGDIDAELIVNLAVDNQAVFVNYELEEI